MKKGGSLMHILAIGLIALSVPFVAIHLAILRECHEDCLVAWLSALAAAVILLFFG